MKFLEVLQNVFTGFFLFIIAISLLTWLGVISPFSKFESSVSNDIENKLRVEADAGDADKQNKLGTLLYTQAKRQNSDFSDAIYWFKNAAKQEHPIAQMNLAFAYKAGNGVPVDKEESIGLFYQSGINFLKMGFPMDAKDCLYSINQINSKHPLKQQLIIAISQHESNN